MPNQTPIPTQLNIAPSGMTWKNWKLVHGTDGFPTRETMEKYLCNPDRVRDLEECRDLNRQTIKQLEALIQLYEAQMEAIGAGGVEPLRKREKLHQIAEPVTAGTAVRAFRDYLGVHDGIKLGGQAMDDMALDLARIALDFKHLVEPQHPDDAAVDALAVLMKAKLAEKRAKGYGGWNDKTQCPQQRLSDMLRAHVDKGDPVDVANFCAMLSARGEGIAAALHPMPAVTMYGKCYEKTFAAPRAVQAAVPDGYAVVSVEKINAAIQRASVFDDGGDGADPESARSVVTLLRDMLTAAPAHPAEGVQAQAEPFMWAIQEPDGSAYMDENCVNSVRENVQAEVDGLNSGLDAEDGLFKVVPVYLAATQPAAQGMEALGAHEHQERSA